MKQVRKDWEIPENFGDFLRFHLEMYNLVNVYLIITYLVSFENKFTALIEDLIVIKSPREHPFSNFDIASCWFKEMFHVMSLILVFMPLGSMH